MRPIPEADNLSGSYFRDYLLAKKEPTVFRGLVRDWPVVRAGRESAAALASYLKQFDRGYDIDTAYGAPSIKGRIFYNDDLSGLNCRMGKSRLSNSLDYLLEHLDDAAPPALAIQSVLIRQYFPGLDSQNVMPEGFVPKQVEPRLWLGSRSTVAAHYDPSENIACSVAGTRKFTLFPPEQVRNLYVGPFELTPAGATISMVDFDEPDHDQFPNFRKAEEAAFQAVLEPGDAIYIPYMWWHHVRSLDKVNGLVNYWWAEADEKCGDPRNALLHAMLTIGTLPEPYRRAWRSMFGHYVFDDPRSAGAHLPEKRRGILGELEPDGIRKLRTALSRALSRK